jgi:outer membrane receptor protein involved in Fe transport
VHAATAAYERGDPAQRLERGRQVELGLAWQQGEAQFTLNAFDARFAN